MAIAPDRPETAQPTPPPAPRESPRASPRAPRWWQRLGPGLITGAADDDPSGIATYSQAGAQFGYGVGWTMLLTFPLMVGIQLASARIGRVTGRDLAENFAQIFPGWLVRGLVGLLLVANIINLGADLNAMADAAVLITGGSAGLYVLAFGLVSLLLQLMLPYRRYVRLLKWLTLSLLAYVALALVVGIDWLAALRGALLPAPVWSRDYLTTIVAILGTTISPYLFFWQAAQEVEEIERAPAERALCEAPAQARRQIRRIKLDTWVGMGFSNAIAFCMIVACAATLHAQGVVEIDSSAQAAEALRPIAGEFAFALFALGIVGTGLLALPVLAGSGAYAVAGLYGWRRGFDRELGQALPFYGVIVAAMALGALLASLGWNPIAALFWAAVINALIAVPIMVAVMLTATRRAVMGELVLSRRWALLGWAATAVMAAASLAMLVSRLIQFITA